MRIPSSDQWRHHVLGIFATVGALGLLCAPPAYGAESDPMVLGARVFLLCRPCHTTAENAPNTIGPNLWGVFGRKAGSKPGFHYSAALKASGIIWSVKTLDRWIINPQRFVPGTYMPFRGIDNPVDRAALIQYLKVQTGEAQAAPETKTPAGEGGGFGR